MAAWQHGMMGGVARGLARLRLARRARLRRARDGAHAHAPAARTPVLPRLRRTRAYGAPAPAARTPGSLATAKICRQGPSVGSRSVAVHFVARIDRFSSPSRGELERSLRHLDLTRRC